MLLSERIQLQLITHPYLHQLRTLNIVYSSCEVSQKVTLWSDLRLPQLLVIIRVF